MHRILLFVPTLIICMEGIDPQTGGKSPAYAREQMRLAQQRREQEGPFLSALTPSAPPTAHGSTGQASEEESSCIDDHETYCKACEQSISEGYAAQHRKTSKHTLNAKRWREAKAAAEKIIVRPQEAPTRPRPNWLNLVQRVAALGQNEENEETGFLLEDILATPEQKRRKMSQIMALLED